MAGPPENLSPAELWVTLCSSERPNKLVDFPRLGIDGLPVARLRIRVLTQEEQMAAAIEAEKMAKLFVKEGKRGDLGFERLFSDALCIETLFRACRSEGDPKQPFFPAPKDMRGQLTTEECSMLFDYYLMTQLELGPTCRSMSQDEMDAWIDKLLEGSSFSPFEQLTWEQQRILLITLALRVRSYQTDSTSVGSPSEVSTSDKNKSVPDEPTQLEMALS